METTCLNLVKEYFDAFIKCMNCQKEESQLNSNVETELTESQLNSNPSNLVDENISIKIDGNNSGYFIKDIDKKDTVKLEEDDNFEIVSWCVNEEAR